MDFDRNKSWDRWAMRMFGQTNRQAGTPTTNHSQDRRLRRDRGDVSDLLNQHTLVSPADAAALAAWPVLGGSTLGDL